jgi:hypothetical protein
MDFSEAERGGFIEAFISFWNRRDNNKRSDVQLRHDASRVLRGCKEHFRSGVTRISRIGGVIPVEQRDVFVEQTVRLVSSPTDEEFIQQARQIIRDFPKTASWLEWWLRPAHASMLFESQRVMDIAIWDTIPESTNAEEAMHWKLYCAAGKNHNFFEGLRSLHAVAMHYEKLYQARLSEWFRNSSESIMVYNNPFVSEGVPIRYGQPERWKKVCDRIGRTKPTRAPTAAEKKRSKNDGRPPDTVKQLLGISPSKKQQKLLDQLNKQLEGPENRGATENNSRRGVRQPAYRWENNSCWLDTSLQLLFVALSRNFPEFSTVAQTVDSESLLRTLHDHFEQRLNPDPLAATEISEILRAHRNDFRQQLIEQGEVFGLTSFQPLMASSLDLKLQYFKPLTFHQFSHGFMAFYATS